MTRVEVAVAELVSAVHELDRAAGVAREMEGRSRAARGTLGGCGHPALAQAGEDLVDGWSHGMRVLTEDAVRLAALLREAAAAYGHVEQCIVAAAGGDAVPALARSR